MTLLGRSVYCEDYSIFSCCEFTFHAPSGFSRSQARSTEIVHYKLYSFRSCSYIFNDITLALSLPVLGLMVDSSFLYEHAHNVEVSLGRGQMEGSTTVIVLSFHVHSRQGEPGKTWRHKNIERHTAHTIVSWAIRNSKQWQMGHTYDLMMIRNGEATELLTLCEGNPLAIGGFPCNWPVMRSLDLFFGHCYSEQTVEQTTQLPVILGHHDCYITSLQFDILINMVQQAGTGNHFNI